MSLRIQRFQAAHQPVLLKWIHAVIHPLKIQPILFFLPAGSLIEQCNLRCQIRYSITEPDHLGQTLPDPLFRIKQKLTILHLVEKKFHVIQLPDAGMKELVERLLFLARHDKKTLMLEKIEGRRRRGR